MKQTGVRQNTPVYQTVGSSAAVDRGLYHQKKDVNECFLVQKRSNTLSSIAVINSMFSYNNYITQITI